MKCRFSYEVSSFDKLNSKNNLEISKNTILSESLISILIVGKRSVIYIVFVEGFRVLFVDKEECELIDPAIPPGWLIQYPKYNREILCIIGPKIRDLDRFTDELFDISEFVVGEIERIQRFQDSECGGSAG